MYGVTIVTVMIELWCTVYPKEYAHGFVVLCFVVVMRSFIMNSHEVFFHIHLGCFAGTGAIVRLPQCQWSKPDGYGKISQCITTTKHSKAKTVCIFLGIYCRYTSRDCMCIIWKHFRNKYAKSPIPFTHVNLNQTPIPCLKNLNYPVLLFINVKYMLATYVLCLH